MQVGGETHTLATQVCEVPHTRPQPPQFLASVAVLTQTPPQLVVPTPQDTTQRPLVQVCPLGQALPHAPQWTRLVLTLTQVAPHIRMGAAQGVPVARQRPSMQFSSAAHGVSHAPQ